MWTDVKVDMWVGLHVLRKGMVQFWVVKDISIYRSHYSNRGYQAKSEENWHPPGKVWSTCPIVLRRVFICNGWWLCCTFCSFQTYPSCSQSHGQRGKVVEHERCFISNRSIVEHFVSAFPRDLGSFLSILRHILMHKNVSLTCDLPPTEIQCYHKDVEKATSNTKQEKNRKPSIKRD